MHAAKIASSHLVYRRLCRMNADDSKWPADLDFRHPGLHAMHLVRVTFSETALAIDRPRVHCYSDASYAACMCAFLNYAPFYAGQVCQLHSNCKGCIRAKRNSDCRSNVKHKHGNVIMCRHLLLQYRALWTIRFPRSRAVNCLFGVFLGDFASTAASISVEAGLKSASTYKVSE